MISIANLTKSYGKKTLFDGVSLMISRGEKIGLIGPNGAGKSTLFSLILGESEPSAGAVQIQRNTRIGYLPQESSFKSELTVLSEMAQHAPRAEVADAPPPRAVARRGPPLVVSSRPLSPSNRPQRLW